MILSGLACKMLRLSIAENNDKGVTKLQAHVGDVSNIEKETSRCSILTLQLEPKDTQRRDNDSKLAGTMTLFFTPKKKIIATRITFVATVSAHTRGL